MSCGRLVVSDWLAADIIPMASQKPVEWVSSLIMRFEEQVGVEVYYKFALFEIALK